MKVDISQDVGRYIEAQLATGRYQTPAEVIADLVRRQKEQDASEHRLWKRQRRALVTLLGKMATLPAPTRDDGLSNRDHDRILYGGQP
jgi:Arc/MetJ-type ribon-helix-helix transcriptional regulator